MNPKLPTPPHRDPDRLFGAYFQKALPAEWPAAPRPWADPVRTNPAPTADPARKSRYALAASVAILLGGCWMLSNQFSAGKAKKDLDLRGGEANINHVKDLGKAPPKAP